MHYIENQNIIAILRNDYIFKKAFLIVSKRLFYEIKFENYLLFI